MIQYTKHDGQMFEHLYKKYSLLKIENDMPS